MSANLHTFILVAGAVTGIGYSIRAGFTTDPKPEETEEQ